MAKIRFEQVDEIVDDALTLLLVKENGVGYGTVNCPAALSGGRFPNDMTSQRMTAKDAFRAAVNFANDVKAPLVVNDPEAVWEQDWGDLYREEGEPPPQA